ncbi:MAG: hypothetical protein JRH20_10780, partial [Deltaproteobacteria bacterium]|nr:hypothetical protein [Deltaproteobacteria bacterium]
MSSQQDTIVQEELSTAHTAFENHGWMGVRARLWAAGLHGAEALPSPVDFCFGQGGRVVALLQPPHLQALGFAGMTVAGCLLPDPPASIWAVDLCSTERSAAELLEAALVAALAGHDAVVLDRFGLWVRGDNWQALQRRVAEVEHAAQVTLLSQQATRTPAPEERVARFIAGLS